jgi:LmbE family N-acetylglucosaminyl deacetylase
VLKLSLAVDRGSPLKILAVGAHADDIEIGCGGTVLELLATYANCEVCWLVLSADGRRATEARRSGDAFLEAAQERRVIVEGFRDGFFPYSGPAIKDFFERLKDEVSPDLILTHHGSDLHQDHRLVSDLTWNTFRDHFILEYEVPKYDGDLGSPNVFVHLDETTVRVKIENILGHFASQAERRWFSEDVFRSMLRLRGMESNSPTLFAEGFYSRKILL